MSEVQIGKCLNCGEVICNTEAMDLLRERDRLKKQIDQIKAAFDSRMDGWMLLAFVDKILKEAPTDEQTAI